MKKAVRKGLLSLRVLTPKVLLFTGLLFPHASIAQPVYRQKDFLDLRNMELKPETHRQMDELIRMTKNHPPDSNLVLAYYQLSQLYHQMGSDSALLYAQRTSDLAKK